MADTLTVDDVETLPPPALVEWAYHLGLVPDEVPAAVIPEPVAVPPGPMYVPDGWT